MLVGDDAVEDGILDAALEGTHLGTGCEAKGAHDFVAVDRRLEVAYAVALLEVLELHAHEAEVVEEALLAHLVLRGDVGLAQHHQVIDVVARLEEQAAYGAIGDLLVGNDDGAHVKPYELLHILHLLVHGKLHVAKDGGYHLFANEVMVVEGPPQTLVPTLGAGFADVVEQSCPAEPQIVGLTGYIVQHLKGVVEVVLMLATIHGLDPLQGGQLGEDEGKQTATVELHEALGGDGRSDDLVEFVDDALLGDDLDALGIAGKRLEGLLLDVEVELCGKAYATHHAQGVVAKGHIGVERGADEAVLHVKQSIKGIGELTEAVGIETHGQGVDGEVAAVLVILEGAILDDGLARVVRVGLLTGPYELNLHVAPLELRRAEVAEDIHMSTAAELLAQGLGNLDATAHDYHVDILRWALQVEIAHVATHGIAFETQLVGRVTDEVKQLRVKHLLQFFGRYMSHILYFGVNGQQSTDYSRYNCQLKTSLLRFGCTSA